MNNRTLYKSIYKTNSNLSDIVMLSDGEFLVGLYFENSKDSKKFDYGSEINELEIFKKTRKWLDIYFSGNEPNFIPKYKIASLTPFQKEIYDILLTISFGKSLSYGDIAKMVARKHNIEKMSAQAVGNAVGANKICIIIPCHRVIGSSNDLIGYGGGIENKKALLEIEGHIIKNNKVIK